MPPEGPKMPNLLGDQGSTLDLPEGDADDVSRITGFGKRIGDIVMDTDAKYRQVGGAMRWLNIHYSEVKFKFDYHELSLIMP